jgi:hypothetical protein
MNPRFVDALVKDYDRALLSVDCHTDRKVRVARPRRGPFPNDEFVQVRPVTVLEEDLSLRRTLRKSSAAHDSNQRVFNTWVAGTNRRLRGLCDRTFTN